MSDEWHEYDSCEDDWDDEGWDDDEELGSDYDEDDEATGPCPECGADLHADAEACYVCGYWLTTADRHKLWDGGSSVRSVMGVGKVVLIVVLITLISGFFIL